MSKSSIRKYVCPKCHQEYEITTYDSINVTIDPDMKEKCTSGDIFHFECPHCHNEYMVSYPCLYHDQERKFMVWLINDGQDEKEIKRLGAPLKAQGYRLRRTRTLLEFLEKIQIFDDGVNDVAVEFAKYDSFIDYIQNKGKQEDVTGISYLCLDNDILKIKLELDDKGLTTLTPYEGLLEQMDEHKDMFTIDDENFPYVDSKWIIQIFEAAEKKQA